jgi:hypothetical protein
VNVIMQVVERLVPKALFLADVLQRVGDNALHL